VSPRRLFFGAKESPSKERRRRRRQRLSREAFFRLSSFTRYFWYLFFFFFSYVICSKRFEGCEGFNKKFLVIKKIFLNQLIISLFIDDLFFCNIFNVKL